MTVTIPPKRPVRFFNTTGPCFPWDHYMLPPADRLIGAQLDRYINDNLYWVLHAPRQTGKTTFLIDWMQKINSCGEAVACYVSVETCQGILDHTRGMRTLHFAICAAARAYNLPIPELSLDNTEPLLYETMRKWSELVAPKPLVVLFDETDLLEGEVLISFLRQLRNGFAERGVGKFPVSVALVGATNLKDYNITSKDNGALYSGVTFNIIVDSVLLGNFSREEVSKLFAQRTEEIGQQITDEALEYVWEQSIGQPRIINSLFERATTHVLKADDYNTVTLSHVEQARDQMVEAWVPHLDSLNARLNNPKIKYIIESILMGSIDPDINRFNPDVERAIDMGLIRWSSADGFTISNPIHKELFTRFLNAS
jgi:type II secretory pathway predicted ATPase ExeA